MDRKQLIACSYYNDGEYSNIINAINNQKQYQEIDIENVITIFDKQYPKRLLELKYPPLVLYYKGNINLLNEESISIVGSRKPCDYALKATAMLAKHYNDKVIVSGLAKGIDACAHYNANKTIGVLGCGIDYVYPYCNVDLFKQIEANGLIISEYPKMVKPLAYHFPFRNRIIAGLSKSMYIMQSKINSGTMTSVNEALELGRDIKILPYDAFCIEGINNNHLINEGGQMILFEELN